MIQMLRSIFLWFYCLDISDAIFFAVMGTGVFLLLHKRFSDRVWWKWLLSATLVCWGLAVICSTVGMRSMSQTPLHNFIPFHSYREVLNGGNPEIYRSNFMNVMLFYPAGLIGMLLLPDKFPGWLRCAFVILVLAVMSIGIEWMQYHFALGRCEADDVIHNTMGALLGSLISLCAANCSVKR